MQVRKVAFASFVGTAIDFYIHGTAAALIAGLLVDDVGGWAVGLMMALFVAVRVLSTWALPETRGASLRDEATSAA